MKRIQVLDHDIAELIAAGEVVERPASIAKELLENSIDAGATQITIEIKGGGVGYLRVTDNGHGIMPEDIPLAFLRHATSKVRNSDDLMAIGTLGFRGEALASIAAVSKVEITSKTEEALEGTTYYIQGEEFDGPHPVGVPTGTTIIVQDVFYNVPARMKFLRRDVAEGNAIAQAVDKCALSYPEVAITFIRDSTIRLRTSGNGDLRSVIAAVYGREFANELLSVDYLFENEIKVTGFISSPAATKATRTYQNFFINRRYVRTRTAATALEQAHKGKIMTGRFPACVLNIDIEPSQVDPNVHPAKIEVRFIQEKPIFNAVYYAVKSALSTLEAPLQSKPSVTQQLSPLEIEVPTEEPEQQRIDSDGMPNLSITPLKASNPLVPETKEDDYSFSDPLSMASGTFANKNIKTDQENPILSTDFDLLSRRNSSTIKDGAKPTISSSQVTAKMPIAETQGKKSQAFEQAPAVSKSPINLRFIGELFHTYILLEQDGELILVDKHAAHERILYEEIRAAASQQADRQVLLAPLPVTLQREEYAVLLEHLDTVLDVGFLVDDFGTGTLLVRETPIHLDGEDVTYLLSEMANKLLSQQKDITPEALENLYDSIACKTALRAGDKNNPRELQEIINLMVDNPQITHCPHGRPIVLRVAQKEIEKMFGRLGS